MKRKYLIVIIILIIVLLAGILCFLTPNGKTLESREEILKNTSSGKYVWEIDKEIKLYDYIISSAYGSKDGLAVFKSYGNNKYKLQSVTYKEKGKVVIEQIVYKSDVYYISKCNQANLDYAEVIYSADNEELEPRIFDVKENNLISFKSPSDDFAMRIIYYDKDGNQYN